MTATLVRTKSYRNQVRSGREALENTTFGDDQFFRARLATATPFSNHEIIQDSTPFYSPISLGIVTDWESENVPALPDQSLEEDTSPAGRAVTDLKSWLAITDQELADLTGLSRRTVINWRAGKGNYNATSRNLLGLHAFVKQLRAKIGPERTTIWLMACQNGSSPLQKLRSDPACVHELVQGALSLLFPPAVETHWFDFDEGEEQQKLSALLPADSESGPRRPARRTRRVPRGR